MLVTLRPDPENNDNAMMERDTLVTHKYMLIPSLLGVTQYDPKDAA